MKRRFYLLLLLLPMLLMTFLGTEAQSISSLIGGADSVNKAIGQQSEKLQELPHRYFAKVSSKANQFNGRITRRTEKALRRLQKQEEKINSKLSKVDSVAAKGLALGRSVDSISHLEDLIKGKAGKLASKIPGSQVLLRAGKYIPRLDSLQTSLNFLTQNQR